MKIHIELQSVDELVAIFALIRGESLTPEQVTQLSEALAAQTAKSAEVAAALKAQK